MIRAEDIPDEVVEAAARAAWEDWRADGREQAPTFDQLKPWAQDEERQHARASIAAALNAWPGGYMLTKVPQVILPLPQKETSDE